MAFGQNSLSFSQGPGAMPQATVSRGLRPKFSQKIKDDAAQLLNTFVRGGGNVTFPQLPTQRIAKVSNFKLALWVTIKRINLGVLPDTLTRGLRRDRAGTINLCRDVRIVQSG